MYWSYVRLLLMIFSTLFVFLPLSMTVLSWSAHDSWWSSFLGCLGMEYVCVSYTSRVDSTRSFFHCGTRSSSLEPFILSARVLNASLSDMPFRVFHFSEYWLQSLTHGGALQKPTIVKFLGIRHFALNRFTIVDSPYEPVCHASPCTLRRACSPVSPAGLS